MAAIPSGGEGFIRFATFALQSFKPASAKMRRPNLDPAFIFIFLGAIILGLGACTSEDMGLGDKTFLCSSDSQCLAGWTCFEGSCQQGFACGAEFCSNDERCVDWHCVPDLDLLDEDADELNPLDASDTDSLAERSDLADTKAELEDQPLDHQGEIPDTSDLDLQQELSDTDAGDLPDQQDLEDQADSSCCTDEACAQISAYHSCNTTTCVCEDSLPSCTQTGDICNPVATQPTPWVCLDDTGSGHCYRGCVQSSDCDAGHFCGLLDGQSVCLASECEGFLSSTCGSDSRCIAAGNDAHQCVTNGNGGVGSDCSTHEQCGAAMLCISQECTLVDCIVDLDESQCANDESCWPVVTGTPGYGQCSDQCSAFPDSCPSGYWCYPSSRDPHQQPGRRRLHPQFGWQRDCFCFM